MPESQLPCDEAPRAPLGAVLACAALALVAGASVVLEYGFRDTHRPVPVHLLHVVDGAAMAGFAAVSLMVALLGSRTSMNKWVDLVVIGVCFAASVPFGWGVLAAGAFYIILSQTAALVGAVVRLVGRHIERGRGGIAPVAALVGLYVVLAGAGSGLLMLPAAKIEGASSMYYQESLLTATSAACLTGLTSREAGLTIFSPLGQGILLAVTQIAGLGAMLFGLLSVTLVGKGLGGAGKLLPPMLRDESPAGLARSARRIIAFTFIAEAVGAVLLFPMFDSALSPSGAASSTVGAVWQSIFHSISALCNSGLSPYSRNLATGINENWEQPLRDHWQVLGVIAPLIVLGSVGLPAIEDLFGFLRRLLGPVSARRPLSTYTRIVLYTTLALIVLGAAGFLLLESKTNESGIQSERYHIADQSYGHGADWPAMTLKERIPHVIFSSIAARSTAFSTFHVDEASTPGKLWLAGLATIGGDAAGCGGGMRVIVIIVLMLAAWSIIGERKDVEVLRRSLPAELLRLAACVGTMYLSMVAMVTLLLSMSMRGHKFIDVVLEALSACANAGFSSGITTSLNHFSIYLLCAAMLIARVGLPAMLLALAMRLRRDATI